MLGMTKKELAELAGYTYRRLYDIDRGLPENGKLFVDAGDGKYDAGLFVQRWVKYNVSHETAEADELNTVKARHEEIKMEKSGMELARMRGELVSAAEIRALWAEIVTVVTQRLLVLPSKIAPMVVGMEKVEVIEGLVDREVRDTLTLIADTPMPENEADGAFGPTRGGEEEG